MAVLMIAHALGGADLADEMVVIYHGRLMESGPVKEIFRAPGHPYLKSLLHVVPRFTWSRASGWCRCGKWKPARV